jgi:hypothetical protein
MLDTLQELGRTARDVYLYDTFEGMTAPTERDVSAREGSAVTEWVRTSGRPYPELFDSERVSEDAVRSLLSGTGYPEHLLHLVRGEVELTLPERAPQQLALLRLDTDWYESTRHELRHLYPRLVRGGVLIIDDYGHWEGCRQAVDEFFRDEAEPVLLIPIDYTARIAVKS